VKRNRIQNAINGEQYAQHSLEQGVKILLSSIEFYVHRKLEED